jgi:transcriptional regulator with XRE-family HTH domain
MNTTEEKARRIQSDFFDMVRSKQGSRYDSEIADAAGISRSLYSQIKNGHKPMSLSVMVRIASVLGIVLEFEIADEEGPL